MRSKALFTALFIAVAAPTSAFAHGTKTPAAQVSPAGAHKLSRAAADARYAQRETKSHDLDKFEGGRIYEDSGGVYVAASLTTILLVVLIVLLI
jgi:hypothetical protein